MFHWGLMITEVKSGCYLHCREKAMCQIQATRSPTSKYWSGTLHVSTIFSRVTVPFLLHPFPRLVFNQLPTFDLRSCLFFLWHLHSVRDIHSEINWPNKRMQLWVNISNLLKLTTRWSQPSLISTLTIEVHPFSPISEITVEFQQAYSMSQSWKILKTRPKHSTQFLGSKNSPFNSIFQFIRSWFCKVRNLCSQLWCLHLQGFSTFQGTSLSSTFLFQIGFGFPQVPGENHPWLLFLYITGEPFVNVCIYIYYILYGKDVV